MPVPRTSKPSSNTVAQGLPHSSRSARDRGKPKFQPSEHELGLPEQPIDIPVNMCYYRAQ